MNLFAYLSDAGNWQGPSGILALLLRHLGYTGAAVGIAAVVAVPLGILLGHTRRGSFLVGGLSSATRAIPSLGLLVLVVLLLSAGVGPIIGVLAVLALPPILAATAAGVRGADREAVHAARALGMTRSQVVRHLEWPLALPLVIAGLRSATVQVVATATVAAYATGTGLGRLVLQGNADRNYPEMFAGALMVAVLAVLLSLILSGLGRLAGRHAHPYVKRPLLVRYEPARG